MQTQNTYIRGTGPHVTVCVGVYGSSETIQVGATRPLLNSIALGHACLVVMHDGAAGVGYSAR